MILIKNAALIATLNDQGDELEGYDLLIRGNRIVQIAPEIQLTPEEAERTEVIDASHHLVLPGLVNTHHHFYQTLTRNLPGAQDAKLFDWLVYHYPRWARLDADAVYWSTLLAMAELLKTGATTSLDHLYLYPRHLKADLVGLQMEAARQIGLRFVASRGSMTRGRSQGGLPPDEVVQTPEEVLEDSVRVIETYHDPAPLAMQRVVLAPCSPFSVEERVMRETARIARQYGVRLHTHLAETRDEEAYCLEAYGRRPLDLMASLDWLGPDVFFAHGIWFNDEELRVLADTGTGIAHCPSSNMRLGSGIARVREMLDLGVRVGLAVDGSASNDTSDMLGEVRNALLLQRVRYGPAGLSAREALRMATRGGADLLGFPDLGTLEEGKGADLILIDLHQLQYAGALSDPVAAVVFAGYRHEVAYSIVNGQVVVRNGKLVTVDEEEIRRQAHQVARRLWA